MSGFRTHGRFAPASLLLAAGLLFTSTPLCFAAGVRVGDAGRVEVGTGPVMVATGAERVLSVGGDEDSWIAAGVRDDGGLVLWSGDAGRSAPMASPAVAGALVAEPRVVGDARVTGLAWLEGDDARHLAVRFASWDGAAWGDSTTVAAPGPGSQLALAASTLGDGRALLAWARFDGTDDEIFWAVQEGSGWSEARALTADSTPDVTPALLATRDGALAAWSSFEDGQYRVAVARFDGRDWGAPRVVGGPGTLYPSFETAEDATGRAGEPLLLYRTARPRGWALLELTPDARPLRRAAAASVATTAERPRIQIQDGAPLFLSRGGALRSTWENLP